MIRLARNKYLIKYFWGFMALYILNMSIDAPDKHPHYIAEDLCFNDQESILEIIIEQIMGFEDAIMEHDDHDVTKKVRFKKTQSLDIFVLSCEGFLCYLKKVFDSKRNYCLYSFHPSNPYIEQDSPPPKV